MKTLCLVACLFSTAAVPAFSQVTTIAQWTFETSPGGTGANGLEYGPRPPDVGSGSLTVSHAGGGPAATWQFGVGNGSPGALGSDHWFPGDSYNFSVGTLGYSNITVYYDQRSDVSGPGDFVLLCNNVQIGQYGVLTSGTWNSTTPSSQYTRTFDLSAVPGASNASIVNFRVISSDPGASIRAFSMIDNITVTGVAIPEPHMFTLWLGVACMSLVAGRRRVWASRTRSVSTSRASLADAV